MKILVFSDSHSNTRKMKEALDIHKNTCEVVLFLGDGLRDIRFLKTQYPKIAFFEVKGNCDLFEADAEEEKLICLDGIKVLITHGHNYGVKSGCGRLIYRAREKEADAVFFGHTHLPLDDVIEINDKSIRLFNPGSIGKDGSYGVVNISGNVLITNHGKIL